MPQSYDTIIIGLGAAGTTAASTLAKAGKRVLALEAQDRVGGRVHTVPFGDGVVEVGQNGRTLELIHGTGGSRVYEMAVQNNISLVPQEFQLKVETLPEDVVKRKCTKLLRKFMSKNITIPDPTDMIWSTWNSNPFTRGSYSYDNLLLVKHIGARTAIGAPLFSSI